MTAAAFPRSAVAQKLDAGLAQLTELAQLVPAAGFPRAALVDYLALLTRWNGAYNLSAVRDPETMVSVHLLDSLTLLPYLEGPLVLDVGSGAGLPGLPLALCRPDLRVTLLDSNGKKTRFLNQARLELGITNLEVVHQRVQDYRPGHAFNTITSRAYARLDTFVEQVLPLLAPGGGALAMKARFDEAAETAGLHPEMAAERLPVSVPGLEACRILVRVRRRH